MSNILENILESAASQVPALVIFSLILFKILQMFFKFLTDINNGIEKTINGLSREINLNTIATTRLTLIFGNKDDAQHSR